MDIYHSDRQPNCDGWSEDGAETHHGQCQATKGKRTYDCNFCKRGFTNAQALGGHMNIHRRDRAKAAKQQLHHHQLVSDEYGYGSPGFAVGDLAGSCNYPALDVHQASRSQYLCFQQRHVGGYSAPRRSTVVPGCLSSDHGDLWGANLSLGIGSGGRKEDRELDLELRLGHVEP